MRTGTAKFACIGLALLISTGFAKERQVPASAKAVSGEITRHIALLRSRSPLERAAAAYWLGQQHSAAAEAVDTLTELLGETTEVDASRYRSNHPRIRLTLGEEAATALVKIGQPSIQPLIRVLRTSPQAEARKNAAWALGALHEQGSDSRPVSAYGYGA